MNYFLETSKAANVEEALQQPLEFCLQGFIYITWYTYSAWKNCTDYNENEDYLAITTLVTANILLYHRHCRSDFHT